MGINNIIDRQDAVAEARSKLLQRVKAAESIKYASKQQDDCEHDMKAFKETIRVDTDNFYNNHMSAYFIVRACTKCHKKIRTDYVVT